MTQSTFFYFVLPLGLVLAAAIAAQVQGWQFARKDRIRAAKDASSGSRRRHEEKVPRQRDRWASAKMILAALLVTVGSMQIVEYAIPDHTAVNMSAAVTPTGADWRPDRLLASGRDQDGSPIYVLKRSAGDPSDGLADILALQRDLELQRHFQKSIAGIPDELSGRGELN